MVDILVSAIVAWSSWIVTALLAAAIWLSIAPFIAQRKKDGDKGRGKLDGRPLHLMPTVPAHWLVGSSPEISRDGHHNFHVKCLSEFGTIFSYFFGPVRVVAINEPELVKEYTLRRYRDFHDRPQAPTAAPTTERGLLFARGEYWDRLHASLVPMFTHRKQLLVYHRAIYRAVRQCLLQPLIDCIEQSTAAGIATTSRTPGDFPHNSKATGRDAAVIGVDGSGNVDGGSKRVVVDIVDLFEDVAFASIGAACFGEATWFANIGDGASSSSLVRAYAANERASAHLGLIPTLLLAICDVSWRPYLHQLLALFPGTIRTATLKQRALVQEWQRMRELKERIDASNAAARKSSISHGSAEPSEGSERKDASRATGEIDSHRDSNSSSNSRHGEGMCSGDNKLGDAEGVSPNTDGEKRMREGESEEGKMDDSMDLLAFLERAKQKHGRDFLTDADPRLILFGLIGAGVATTSATMGFAAFLLARHPEVAAKAREEVDAFFARIGGTEEISPVRETVPNDEKGARPAFDELSQFPYMDAVLKETMRLYPAAHMVARKASRDTLLAGYHIPFDTPIVTSVFAAHRSERFFPLASEFLPERFLERAKWLKAQQAAREDRHSSQGKEMQGHRFDARISEQQHSAASPCQNNRSSKGTEVQGESACDPLTGAGHGCGADSAESGQGSLWWQESEDMYMPFGSGPRGCIGFKFATMEVKQCLILFLRHFEFEIPRVLAGGEANPDYDRPILELPLTAALNLRPSDGVHLRVWRRDK